LQPWRRKSEKGFAMSPDRYVWIAAGFLGVLLAAGVIWQLIKAFAFNGGPAFFSTRERRRLALVDWTSIGGGRQLLLVRRDNVEHLILIGGPIDVVVESGIGKETMVREIAAHEAVSEPQPAARARVDFPRFEQSEFGLAPARSAERESAPQPAPDGLDGKDALPFFGAAAADKTHPAAAEQKD
jgi:flagellar protein FliO/FliZ